MTLSARGLAAATTGALLLLLAAAPGPGEALAVLRDPAGAPEATAPVVAALSLLAWLLTGWLLLVVLLTLGARVPGGVGRAGAAVARRVAPAALRRTVEVALGLSVTVGVLAGPAAAATDPDPDPRPAPAASLDWGGGDRGPDLDWPAADRPADPAPSVVTEVHAAPAATAAAAEPRVVVRPGDTLWDLAEQHLAERGGAAPSDAQTASAWPAWWAANREAVGDDPDLLLPGTELRPPPETPAG